MSAGSPKISVVIPVCDRIEQVSRALDSVLRQDYPNFDVHIIENNSKDPEAVAFRINEFKDSRVHIHHLNPCGNANVARNFGVDMSAGEYVAFLDSDDEWYPEHLSLAAKAISETAAAFYYGSIEVWNGSGLVVHPSRSLQKLEDPADYLFVAKGSASTCSYVVSRKLLDMVRWDPALKRHQDFDFFINATRRFSSYGDPEVSVRVNWLRGEARSYDALSMIGFYKKHRFHMSRRAAQRFCYGKIRLAIKVRDKYLLLFFVQAFLSAFMQQRLK